MSDGTTIVTNFFSAYDWPISVMWAQSDLSKFPSTAVPGTNGTLPTGNDPASPTRTDGTTASSTSTPSDPQGLSTAAKAGIGVGVALLVLGLLAAGVLFYRRRKGRRVQPEGDVQMVQSGPSAVASPAKSSQNGARTSEMEASSGTFSQYRDRSELDGNALPGYRPYTPGR